MKIDPNTVYNTELLVFLAVLLVIIGVAYWPRKKDIKSETRQISVFYKPTPDDPVVAGIYVSEVSVTDLQDGFNIVFTLNDRVGTVFGPSHRQKYESRLIQEQERDCREYEVLLGKGDYSTVAMLKWVSKINQRLRVAATRKIE